MEFVKITKQNFNIYYSLLEQDFPFDERKSRQEELNALDNDKFKPYFIYDDSCLVGYFTYWEFDEFVFGEHLAILKEIRNKGLGTKVLTQFVNSLNKPFVFEVERPVDELTTRRVELYKRLGFIINGYDYYQPSYHKANDAIPMYIVSYPKPLTNDEYIKYVDVVKHHVYNI